MSEQVQNPVDDWKDNEPGYSYTTIKLRVKDNSIQVKMDFWPDMNPKNPTFDQVAGSVGVAAIAEFIRTGNLPEPPHADGKN